MTAKVLMTLAAVVIVSGAAYGRQCLQPVVQAPVLVDKPAPVLAAVIPMEKVEPQIANNEEALQQVPQQTSTQAAPEPAAKPVQQKVAKAVTTPVQLADKPAVASTVTEQAPAAAAVINLPGSPYQLGPSRDMTFTTRIVAKNTGDATSANVRLEVPLVSANSLYQSNKAENFSIQPVEIKTVSGTRVAVFSLGNLEPGEERVLEVRNQLRTSTPQFFADYLPVDNKKETSYLAASSGIESDNGQIIRLANEITGNLSTDWEKARAITRWVAENITYDAASSNRNSGALQALQNRKGVCEDYAALAAALARAVGIPARVVYGYTDNGSNWPANGTFALRGYRHAWVEYSLEGRGWVPAEPTRSNATTLYFGSLPHNRYIIQNYSNISLKGGFSGGKLSVSWADSIN